jgi:hypothetical protein
MNLTGVWSFKFLSSCGWLCSALKLGDPERLFTAGERTMNGSCQVWAAAFSIVSLSSSQLNEGDDDVQEDPDRDRWI